MPKLVISLDDFSVVPGIVEEHPTQEKPLKFNQRLIKQLSELIATRGTFDYSTVEFFINFNSKQKHEKTNKIDNDAKEFFSVIQQLVQYIKDLFPQLNIVLNPFLLADLYTQSPNGTIFNSILQDSLSDEQLRTIYDSSRWSNIYAQMWLSSSSNRGKACEESIDFYIITGNELTYKSLYMQMMQDRRYIPNAITLHYIYDVTFNGKIYYTPPERLVGIGEANSFWRETLLAIATSANENVLVSVQDDVVTINIPPNTHLDFAKFLYPHPTSMQYGAGSAITDCIESWNKNILDSSTIHFIDFIKYQELYNTIQNARELRQRSPSTHSINSFVHNNNKSEKLANNTASRTDTTTQSSPISHGFGMRHFPFFGRRSSPTTPPEVTLPTPCITRLVQQLKDAPGANKPRSNTIN